MFHTNILFKCICMVGPSSLKRGYFEFPVFSLFNLGIIFLGSALQSFTINYFELPLFRVTVFFISHVSLK